MSIHLPEPIWNAAAGVVRSWLASRLPGLLLRGYPPARIAERFDVLVEHVRFIGIISAGPGSVSLYLRYLNFNPFRLTVEFVSIDVAVGHNPIADIQRRDVRAVGPSQALPPFHYGQVFRDRQIFFELKIEASRVNWLKEQLAGPAAGGLSVNVRLSVSGRGPKGDWNKEDLDFYFPGETVAGLR